MSVKRNYPRRSPILAISTISIAIASFLYTFVGGTGGPKHFDLSLTYIFTYLFAGPWQDRLAAAGLLFILLALISFIAFALIKVNQGKKLLAERMVAIADKVSDRECFPRPCDDTDIPAIVDCADQLFDGATDLEQTLRLHRTDQNAFTVYQDADGNFLGYSCVVRLTKRGVASLKRDDFSILNIPLEYIRRDEKMNDCYLYIGAVCSVDRSYNSVIYSSLCGGIVKQSPKAVYARAASDAGLRAMKRWKFSALHHGKEGVGHIYHRKR